MAQKDDIDQELQDQAEAEAEAVEGSADAAEAKVDATARDAEAAKREIADLKAKLVRWQADFQNMQRRAAREVLEARQMADADFAKSMLQVLDHFDMALSVDPAKVDAKGLLDGIKITYDELKKVLSNRGIESFDATGK